MIVVKCYTHPNFVIRKYEQLSFVVKETFSYQWQNHAPPLHQPAGIRAHIMEVACKQFIKYFGGTTFQKIYAMTNFALES